MNAKRLTPLFRLSIRACIMWIALSACTQLNLTTNTPSATMIPTIAPTAVASLTWTLTVVPTVVPSLTLTWTPKPSLTPSNTPTITPTPAPTWTPWQVDMYFQPSAVAVFSHDNPVQGCLLDYFDITSEPGHTGVNRRDNGGYFACVSTQEANQ